MSAASTATGFLHPGAMGSTVAAACSGEKFWASDGRSAATAQRAADAGLADVGTLRALVDRCDTIVSVCPPDRALDLARSVADAGFTGAYVDANAVSPGTAHEIGALFDRFVDGGIVGPPAMQAGTTRMYLSGDSAAPVAERWRGSALDVRVIDGGIGAASALKMAYAGWTKASGALLIAIGAVADSYGVADELTEEWAISIPDLPQRLAATATRTAPKAWRFEGEMHQIAETFAAVGLPPEFHRAAAEVYRRMAEFKGADPLPDLEAVVEAVRSSDTDA